VARLEGGFGSGCDMAVEASKTAVGARWWEMTIGWGVSRWSSHDVM